MPHVTLDMLSPVQREAALRQMAPQRVGRATTHGDTSNALAGVLDTRNAPERILARSSGIVALTLPYPPTVNHYYVRTRHGMAIGKAGKAYRVTVADKVAKNRVTRLDGAITMRIHVHPPDRRKRDLDNVNKALWDALQHAGVYQDDTQIAEYSVKRCAKCDGGKVVIELWETS